MTNLDPQLVAPASLPGYLDGATVLADTVNAICDRIDEIDPLVRAIVPEPGRRERLLGEVAALGARYPDPAARPALYGALVGVKDIIAVDGLPTRGGSALPPEALAMPEASVVTRLREVGALILGKTVTTEFAARDPGATTNPHNRAHTPGGSSSGSAAGLAAGLFHLSLGSQTVGSVIRPAAFCGVAGYKPSAGRIPRDGVITYSESADHVGLFANDAAGLRRAAPAVVTSWDSSVEVDTGTPPRVGVTEGPYLDQADHDARITLEAALAHLDGPAHVLRMRVFEDIAEINRRHEALVAAEFAEAHADRFAEWGSLYRPFSAQHVEEGRAVRAEDVAAGRASQLKLRASIDELCSSYELDLVASVPAVGAAPEGLSWTGDARMNLPWTHSGHPAVTIPAGTNPDGLPMGVQLIAPFGHDEQLLAWAEHLEAHINAS
jgi:Asp-tRNA(Asn)/Glu-tRNA(Gln) amidotransferase A subunit family amidase